MINISIIKNYGRYTYVLKLENELLGDSYSCIGFELNGPVHARALNKHELLQLKSIIDSELDLNEKENDRS